MKAVNLWPVTLNGHTSPGCAVDYRAYGGYRVGAMHMEIRKSLLELSHFDDIIWAGMRGTHADVALFHTETAEIWGTVNILKRERMMRDAGQWSSFTPPGNNHGTLMNGKHSLYLALRESIPRSTCSTFSLASDMCTICCSDLMLHRV